MLKRFRCGFPLWIPKLTQYQQTQWQQPLASLFYQPEARLQQRQQFVFQKRSAGQEA